MNKSRKRTLLQLQTRLPNKMAITTGIMVVLILFVYFCNIPNPNMILIAGLVLCSALFGFGGGIVAAVIMLAYTLFFFSTDNSFVHFTPQNMQKVFVSFIGIAADMLLVCFLKRTEVEAFDQVEALTNELHRENEKLQRISLVDALTGNRNRMALREDYDSYQGHEVTVMMLDLNNFKQINDTRGHEEGDRMLRETGKLLIETFGEKHCYRYGGDEFLVILEDVPEAEFQERLDAMMRSRPVEDGDERLDFSVGYVHAMLTDSERLRKLIALADEKMYEAKRDQKQFPEMPEEPEPQQTGEGEYTVDEMRSYLAEMSGKYDLARVVDPIECRVLQLQEDGKVSLNESCYGIWNADQKCTNCASAKACKTGVHQEKNEHFQDRVFHIESNPVALRLADGSVYSTVVELVKIGHEGTASANDREAENDGGRATRHLAQHDSLTNALNADAFYELSRKLIMNCAEMEWVMITGNILHFHLVNALFGVLKGNEVLVKTASMLKRISDGAGGLCGRLGGDQFALLLPRQAFREEDFLHTAQVLSKSFNSGIYTFCIHFGVYMIDDPSIPVSVMCGRANAALRTIREDLSHTVAYFDDAILNKTILEQKVISGFDEALKSGQFQMYLQPLVGKDGKAIGAEALVRWCKPDGSVVMPGEFIETLENAGLIQRLDLHIWELAVKQLSAWKGTDKQDLTISVNMSAKDFFSMDVCDALSKLVEKYGIDARKLRLEITETALLVEPDKSNAIVSKLRQMGFLVEIDDFGKGYSSLSLLKNIQADVLKIDMGFLREIVDLDRSKVILKSVIDLADSLGMDVITEGVETRQQLDALSEMGCCHFQGYYFSRPIPIEEFEQRMLADSGA